MKNRYVLVLILLITLATLLLTSCKPVHRFTKLKKVPREYRMNYCDGETKAPRHFYWDRDPWIVFSDHADNKTYTRPGGKITMKKVGFMEPFWVIGRKGKYLRLVRYNKEIVKNGKLTDRKKAAYSGWISESDILTSRNSVTDLRIGKNNKYLVIINDTLPLYQPEYLIKNDSVLIYKDKDMAMPIGTMPFYGIVYRMKETNDHTRSLVSKVSYLSPDSVGKQTLGWVSNTFLRNVGGQHYIHMSPVFRKGLLFRDFKNKDTIHVSENLSGEHSLADVSSLKYNPVHSFKRDSDKTIIKTGVYASIIDFRDNYVFNVNGDKIGYRDYKKIKNDLAKINLWFVWEGTKESILQYSQAINAIQELQLHTNASSPTFQYTYGGVLGFRSKKEDMVVIPSTPSFMTFMDSLSCLVDSIHQYHPSVSKSSWPALRKALEMTMEKKDETNLIVLIGETGYQSELADTSLTRQMAGGNCRLLGFQLYGGEQNTYNNFVLQVESMIDASAKLISSRKRKLLVSTGQLRDANLYKEIAKNVYSLDFPDRSMTQGRIIFPEKKQKTNFNLLTSGVDTLLCQIEKDNSEISRYLQGAFVRSGNYRSKYDSTLVTYYGMLPQQQSNKKIMDIFHKETPYWYLPTASIEVPDSLCHELTHHLLLNDNELQSLRTLLKELSSYQIDYKYEKAKKIKKKDKCNCPDDDYVVVQNYPLENTLSTPVYAGTHRIRRAIYQFYIHESNKEKVCRTKRKILKNSRISRLHELILQSPTTHPVLNAFTLRQLKDKRILDDETLDQLLEYFREKTETLEKSVCQLPRFYSNGQCFYWIDENMLP